MHKFANTQPSVLKLLCHTRHSPFCFDVYLIIQYFVLLYLIFISFNHWQNLRFNNFQEWITLGSKWEILFEHMVTPFMQWTLNYHYYKLVLAIRELIEDATTRHFILILQTFINKNWFSKVYPINSLLCLCRYSLEIP